MPGAAAGALACCPEGRYACCMPANKSADSDKQRGTTRSKPVDIARGVANTRHECGKNDTHPDDAGLACDIVRVQDRYSKRLKIRGRARLRVRLSESFVCRTEAAAALVMRRFEAFLAELDGYKLPE